MPLRSILFHLGDTYEIQEQRCDRCLQTRIFTGRLRWFTDQLMLVLQHQAIKMLTTLL